MKPKILAITPHFWRSGSEIALFNLLDSIKNNFKITIFTPNENPSLKDELSNDIKLIHPSYFRVKSKSIFSKIIRKAIAIYRFASNDSPIDRLVSANNFDFILLNTLVSLTFFDKLKNKGKKIVLYVHETEQLLTLLNKEQLDQMIDKVDLILCSSKYVKDYIKVLGRKDRIDVLYPSLDFSKFILPIKTNLIRKQLGFEKTNFIWAMSGDITINKNPKVFIEAAQKLYLSNSNVRFLWIGVSKENAYTVYLKELINAMKLDSIVKFISKKTDDYYQYINEIDGFVLTSYSESYSLVAKEAACFNKPVVSFPCGGILEAVHKRHRLVTKEFSVDELVALMSEAMTKPKKEIKIEELDNLFFNEKINTGKEFVNIIRNNFPYL